jgi:phosphohistidine phosphatase
LAEPRKGLRSFCPLNTPIHECILLPVTLYLVQHGEAAAEAVDARKPLSPQGLRDVRALAAACRQFSLRARDIIHSGKLRAEQTAGILAESLALPVRAVAGLDPLDPAKPVAHQCEEWTDDRIIVGHMPFLGRLATLLLADREDPPAVTFQRGGMICLEKHGPREWSLLWTCFPRQPK